MIINLPTKFNYVTAEYDTKSFTHKMAAKTNWHRYGTKLHHTLPRVLCKTFVDCAKITKYCFAFLHGKSCSIICRWSPTCVSHRGFAGDHTQRSPAVQPAQFWVRLASVSCMTKILCHDNVDWRHSVCQQDMASSSVTIIFAPPRQTFATNGKVSRQGWWFCEIPVHSIITVLIHNSGRFGPPLPFWAPGPPGIAGAADG